MYSKEAHIINPLKIISEDEIKEIYKDTKIPSSGEEGLRWLYDAIMGTLKEMKEKGANTLLDLERLS